MMRRLSALLALPLALSVSSVSLQAQDGAAIFKRCAACHLPNAAGVPGAYPPLKADFAALAGAKAGRRYLALAVLNGLSGPITVGGKAFRGTMPAQRGLDDAQIAAVLNHLLKGTQAKPFSAEEVAGFRASGAALDSAAVAKLRPSPAGK